jgi:ATP-binding protein involved in chromosome partitioning
MPMVRFIWGIYWNITEQDIVSSNALDSIEINGDKVTINILLSYPAQSYHQTLTDAITSALSAANIKDVTVNIETKIASRLTYFAYHDLR